MGEAWKARARVRDVLICVCVCIFILVGRDTEGEGRCPWSSEQLVPRKRAISELELFREMLPSGIVSSISTTTSFQLSAHARSGTSEACMSNGSPLESPLDTVSKSNRSLHGVVHSLESRHRDRADHAQDARDPLEDEAFQRLPLSTFCMIASDLRGSPEGRRSRILQCSRKI